ncbi:MAG: hypothetical protein PHV34_12965 [Verrucomicrobiae bacterium]|nr:hypothetical protein [Verrucomicrobiae bacterium]
MSLLQSADPLELKPYEYVEDFESGKDPVQPWISHGKYTINFKGVTEEKVFSGKKSYKLDVTLDNTALVYFKIKFPLLPAQGRLHFETQVLTGEKNTGSCAFGYNLNYEPTVRDCIWNFKNPIKTTDGKWLLEQNEGPIDYANNAGLMTVTKYVWGVQKEEVSPFIESPIIVLKGGRGARVVVYLDDIRLTGMLPPLDTYKAQMARRWQPAREKFERLMESWTAIVSRAKSSLDKQRELSKTAAMMKQSAEKKLAALEDEIKEIQKKGFLFNEKKSEQAPILEFFEQFDPSTLSTVDQYLAKEKTPFIPYSIPPITGLKILPSDALLPGALNGGLRVTACPDTREPASFALFALENLNDLQFQMTELKSAQGNIIPASQVDIRVNKRWYQAGGAWQSVDNPKIAKRELVPELLLHDDALVQVDYREEKNYLNLSFPEGAKRRWISDPDEKWPANYYINPHSVLIPINEFPVKDAPRLQPVNIPANTNKRFWVTVHTPADAKPGVYEAEIIPTLAGKKAGAIHLRLEVLPFNLPNPYYTSSIYYSSTLHEKHPHGSISSTYRSEEQIRAEMRNMVEHGVTNPACYQPFSNKVLFERYLQLRKEAGIKGPLYTVSSVDLTSYSKHPGETKARIQELISLARQYDIPEVYFYGIDEATGEKLNAQREAWQAVHEAGGKIFVAGYRQINFEAVGDIQDVLVCCGPPNREEAAQWHGKKHKIWCYFNPQGGVENPLVYRKNYGLLLWQNDYDGACTWAYNWSMGNIWNDFDNKACRDPNMAYPTVDGVIDTIAWEGYRAGIDDVRYVTALTAAIEAARTANNPKKAKQLAAAENFLKNLKQCDLDRENLDSLRRQIADHIMQLN